MLWGLCQLSGRLEGVFLMFLVASPSLGGFRRHKQHAYRATMAKGVCFLLENKLSRNVGTREIKYGGSPAYFPFLAICRHVLV